MGSLTSLLSGPIKDIIESVGGIIGKFVTDPGERLKADLAAAQLQADFTLKLAELEGQWAQTQASVITAEVKSESWLARDCRPILMLTFTYIIAHNYIIAPLFSVGSVPITPDMWELLRIGVGGYVFARSAEKIAPQVVQAMKK
jgi:Holin of 3TMs, for gene-transfer release